MVEPLTSLHRWLTCEEYQYINNSFWLFIINQFINSFDLTFWIMERETFVMVAARLIVEKSWMINDYIKCTINLYHLFSFHCEYEYNIHSSMCQRFGGKTWQACIVHWGNGWKIKLHRAFWKFLVRLEQNHKSFLTGTARWICIP